MSGNTPPGDAPVGVDLPPRVTTRAGDRPRFVSSITALWGSRNILSLLIRRDLVVKYQSSVLGYLWSLIEPLTVAATYWFIFGVLYGEKVGDGDVPYVLYLASGLFAWIWISGVLGEATTALTAQNRLITTIRMPREIFAIGRVAAKGFEYLASLPVLVLVAILLHGHFGWHLFYLPLAITVEAVFLVGLALLLASLNVMLRDTEKVARLLQRVLLYTIPVIYPLSRVLDSGLPGWLKEAYQLNPLVGIIELHHAVWSRTPPVWNAIWVAMIGSVLMLGIGYWVFRRLEPAVLKEL
jgi:ABC-2 type transport system permease protein